MPVGVLAAQLIHAAGESNPDAFHCNAVALHVENEESLAFKAAQLADVGIPHVLIHEQDPPWNGQLMAIGIHPVIRSADKEFRRIVAGLKLVK